MSNPETAGNVNDNVVKFPQRADDGIPETIPLTPELKKMIEDGKFSASPLIHATDRDYERQADGSLRRVTPKPGEKQERPIDWRERAIKAEKFFLGLVEERKKIRDLLQENIRDIKGHNFACAMGNLNDYEPFLMLDAFARGVPHIVRPPLETMSFDGIRCVKRIQKGETTTDLFLDCAHVLVIDNTNIEMLQSVKINQSIPCPICTQSLKERGLYAEGQTQPKET